MDAKPGDEVEVRMLGTVEEITQDVLGVRAKVKMSRKGEFGFLQYVICDYSNIWTSQDETSDLKT